MAKAKGIKKVGYVDVQNHGHAGVNTVHWHDCAGGGQVVVQNKVAYVGNMRNPHGTQIIDLKDPAKPQEVGRWWMPGQWAAGGEQPTWKNDAHKCLKACCARSCPRRRRPISKRCAATARYLSSRRQQP